MSWEVAKKTIDYVLDNEWYFNEESVIWDFIGGEPFLEIDLIDQICDYIKIELFKRNHKWFNSYRFQQMVLIIIVIKSKTLSRKILTISALP